MPEIRVSPITGDAEMQQSVEVYNSVNPRDPVDLAEVHEWERQARAAASYLAYVDGTLAGGAHIAMTAHRYPSAAVYVLQEHRRHGAGAALYRAVSDWARSHAKTGVRGEVAEDDADSLGWAERRGFREQSRDVFVELELAAVDLPPVEPPPEIEIVTWAERPELARGLWEVAQEAMHDMPGSDDDEPEPFDEWLSVHMSGSGDRPEGVFVAVAGDDVVGYAKFSFWSAQPTTLFHDLTTVRRSWRGRGIARALKHTQIRWAKEHGFERLRTSNEQRNEPIRRLNEQLGYRPIPGRIRLRGPLAPP